MYKPVLHYGQILGKAWHEQRLQEQQNQRKSFLKEKKLLEETVHTQLQIQRHTQEARVKEDETHLK